MYYMTFMTFVGIFGQGYSSLMVPSVPSGAAELYAASFAVPCVVASRPWHAPAAQWRLNPSEKSWMADE
jgi:hypothetical protein